LRQAYAFTKQLVSLGSNIASASTITPPSTGSVFNITGVVAITTIASTNSWDGRTITLIFAGILTLTHSSNLALPGAANITTAANDVATFVQTASGAWRCRTYTPAVSSIISLYLPLAGGTMTGAVTGITNLTTTGNTILGNAQGDTLNVAAGAIAVGASGNVTLAAPASGVTETITGLAGADAWVANGGTSGSFRVNTTGVPYGTSLHNNAGAVTGTTNQYITSGTYTPTGTAVTNVATITPRKSQWMRVGNVVTCGATITIDVTAAAPTASVFRFSLPVASNLAATYDLVGAGTMTSGAFIGIAITGDITNDQARVDFSAVTDPGATDMYFQFIYEVL